MNTNTGYPLPQGCTISGNMTNFSIAVPAGRQCELLLYKKGESSPCQVWELSENTLTGSLRFIAVQLDSPTSWEYNYRIDGSIVPDPYGKAFTGRNQWNKDKNTEEHEVRTRIIEDSFPWEDDRMPRLPMQNVIAYNLHMRGFTKHASSKVKHKGTFKGLLEKLPYIQELGINQIQCMPVYDFEEMQEKYVNYWGYGDGYYFAPKASYAADDPVIELKELVKSLHQAGIELVIEMPFTGDTPKTMITDCLRYWAMQYHIDGFIVNPVLCDIQAFTKDPVLACTKILKKQDNFQNTMRRFLKGDEGMIHDVTWWLKHQSGSEGIFNYIANHNGFTLYDTVSYDGKHNELNGERNQDGPDYNYSWNCGAEGPSRKKAVAELRKNQIRNAFLLLLLAQGTPCLLAGDEFFNTQKGNNNVYCQDNPTAWLDWNRLEKNSRLHKFVKDLIAFRKSHKVLYPDHEMLGIDYTSCGIPDVSYHGESAWRMPSEISSRQLGVFYHETSGKEDNCFVAYNMHWLPHTFALPKLPKGQVWHEVISTEEGILESPKPIKEKKVMLNERTIRVFIGMQEEV